MPPLHVVTDDSVLARRGWLEEALEVLATGGPALALHVRGSRTSGRALYDVAAALTEAARRAGARLVVNDRVDVALAVGADGVHLGARSLRPAVARALTGPGLLLGLSVHPGRPGSAWSPSGVDYVVAGNVFATASHPGLPGIGMNGLRDAVERAGDRAVLAIGGVDPARVGEVVRAGAAGVAVLSGVWGRKDPSDAIREYLHALEGARR